MSLSRRQFISRAAIAAVGFSSMRTLFAASSGSLSKALPADGYGQLLSDPQGVVDLPEGFKYDIISRMGDPMDDGFLVPGRPDGMAAFEAADGATIIVRNHEVNPGADSDEGPYGEYDERFDRIAEDALFDKGAEGKRCYGGTTTIVYDTKSQRVRKQYVSLMGTLRNCAGGPTPWGSWLTCEETVVSRSDGFLKDHGYIFEVPASDKIKLYDAKPLKAMGRFNHEAVAVDPASGVIYLTEDRHDGLLYRFIPNNKERLEDGGTLQALVVAGRSSLDTRNWEETAVKKGERLKVSWITLDNVEAPEDDLRFRGFDAGAARFARGEGMWYGEGAVFFACTNGGSAKKGQIWKYYPSEHEAAAGEKNVPGELELFVEPNDGEIVDNADNITFAPWGDLIVCEDGSGEQFLLGVTPEGKIYKFARNAKNDSEFAGACFSPDGSTLFVNIQHSGLTLAITGPWRA